MFGFKIVKKSTLQKLEDDRDDLQTQLYNSNTNRSKVERHCKEVQAELAHANTHIKVLKEFAAFYRTNSRPIDPVTKRMLKRSDWKKIEKRAAEHVIHELSISRGDLINKYA